jgi:hypothetical protein
MRIFMSTLGIAAIAGGLIAGPAPAGAAVTITATLTADNHYGLYTGNKEASDLHFIGRNELGIDGSTGAYNWSQAETFSKAVDGKAVGVNPGDYLYVVAWNDGPFPSSDNPQMWIGSFLGSNGKTVVSDAANWQYKIGPAVKFPFDAASGNAVLPDAAVLASVIGNKTNPFGNVVAQAVNGTSPWGTIAGVDSAAQFIWSDTLIAGSNTDGQFVIFRENSPFVAGVPELSTWAMMIIGFGGVGLQMRRRSTNVAVTA